MACGRVSLPEEKQRNKGTSDLVHIDGVFQWMGGKRHNQAWQESECTTTTVQLLTSTLTAT